MSAERILIAHPAADLYGSDLQLVEAVRALRAAGAADAGSSRPGPSRSATASDGRGGVG